MLFVSLLEEQEGEVQHVQSVNGAIINAIRPFAMKIRYVNQSSTLVYQMKKNKSSTHEAY